MVSRRRVSRIAQITGGGLLAFMLFFAAACGDSGDSDGIDLPDMDNGSSSDTLPGDGGSGVDPLTPPAGDGADGGGSTLPGEGSSDGGGTIPGDGGPDSDGGAGGGSTLP